MVGHDLLEIFLWFLERISSAGIYYFGQAQRVRWVICGFKSAFFKFVIEDYNPTRGNKQPPKFLGGRRSLLKGPWRNHKYILGRFSGHVNNRGTRHFQKVTFSIIFDVRSGVTFARTNAAKNRKTNCPSASPNLRAFPCWMKINRRLETTTWSNIIEVSDDNHS